MDDEAAANKTAVERAAAEATAQEETIVWNAWMMRQLLMRLLLR